MSTDEGDVPARPGEEGDAARAADAALVEAARAGDERAFGRLFDRWFDPVHDIAWRILRDRDDAAEVAQDVFLVAWQGLGDLEQPGSFGGWVRRIARNRALNRLDRERRSRPDSAAAAAALERAAPDVDMTAALGEREQTELVWAAASALGERDASLLDLHLRHGMGAPEIAAELGVTPNNAHQLLYRLRGKLGGAVRAWVLWRGGGAPCPGLDRAVAAAGVTAFGAEAVRVVDRHARACAACEKRRQLRLAPEALFAAVPIAAAPPLVKAEAAAALAEAGVPMAGSAAAAGTGGAGGDMPDGGASDLGHGAGGDGAGGDAGASAGPGGDGATAEGAGGDTPDGPAGDAGPGGDGAATEGAAGDAAGDGPARDAPTAEEPAATDAAVPPTEVVAVEASPPPSSDPGDVPPARWARARRRALVLTGAILVVLLAAFVVLSGDDPDEVATGERRATTTSAAPPTTGATAPPTTEVVAALPESAPLTAEAPDRPPAPTRPAGGTRTTPTTVTSEVPPPAPPDPPPAPPAPVIGGFRGTRTTVSCGSSSATTEVTLVWQSTDATSAAVSGVGSGLPPSGSATACAAPGTIFTLTVTGPGGTATARTPPL